eukprot:5798035-Alexandrium_andersonii.AAC.1
MLLRYVVVACWSHACGCTYAACRTLTGWQCGWLGRTCVPARSAVVPCKSICASGFAGAWVRGCVGAWVRGC